MPITITASEIVAYSRIEPRSIARDYRPTVRAQVHDALWMLTQQWRVGEFKGEDAGTLVKARIQTQTTMLNRFESRTQGIVEAFNENIPLEAKVERLPVPSDLGVQLELSSIWRKLIAKAYPAQLTTIFNQFLTAFPIAPLNSGSPAEQWSNRPAVQVRQVVVGKSMNGYAFYEFLKGGGSATTIAPGYPLLAAQQTKFLQWMSATYYTPEVKEKIAWSDRELEYKCSVSAPVTSTAGGLQYVLRADKYKRGDMDWYSFDLDNDSGSKLIETGTPINNGAAVKAPVTFSYIPQTIEFKGMPKGRWWEFEDKHQDLSKMLTQRHDPSKMVIMEFGLIYSNDWFIIPHVVPDGSVNSVNALVTTDVFGRNFVVERAGSRIEEQWQRWDMYNTTRQGLTTGEETWAKLLMIPAVKARMESEAVESVMFLRDEMANMIWGVEEVVPNELLGGMDGKNANNEVQQYLMKTYPTPANPPGYLGNNALHRFQLTSSVPENWIPFIPTKQTTSAFGGRDVMVQRAIMRRYIDDNFTDDLIRPRTAILSVGVAENQPYFINEEVVSRPGFVISSHFQRARWYDGRTVTWFGRKVQAGKGEGNSGLKFDILADKEVDV